MIQVKNFFAFNDLRNFSYLIYDQNSGETWAIDPYHGQELVDYIKKESLILKGILNTHHHFDHIKGNEALRNAFKVDVHRLNELQIQLNQDHQIHIVDSPGHTEDHKVFLWKALDKFKGLFSGDTLFNAGVGNCKDHTGNVRTLYETTQKLLTLPDDVILYPGHDYIKKNLNFALQCEPENVFIKEALREVSSHQTEQGMKWTLGQEKKVNPFLRLDSIEIQENIIDKAKKIEHNVEEELFIKLRSLRDNW